MKQLTEIGLKYGTDKAEYHKFTEVYDDFFREVADKVDKVRILEIGILDGGSLKMYNDFFRRNAIIVGIDTDEKGHLFPNETNILCLRGDILKPEVIQKAKAANPYGYDIIIDDGGHYMEQQQKTLWNLWPLLNPGGIFIVEDLHTSGNEDYNPDRTTTTLTILDGIGEGQIHKSLYLTEQQVKMLSDDMEKCIVARFEYPQVGTQPPRMSITSIIVKKGELLRKPVPLEEPKPFFQRALSMEEAINLELDVNKDAEHPTAGSLTSEIELSEDSQNKQQIIAGPDGMRGAESLGKTTEVPNGEQQTLDQAIENEMNVKGGNPS